ncbi:hypothetical protein JRI60_21775 [Archangium violaceum]|uniref:hypothetical protein n=1 Tax=Archangium violaceum TaxID=83451 RepID=UPI001950ED58|nr:hypothetical protein [Archangium violaceum]QRO01458.1 hypothetical protein JRI60_21775 [Archangium violaceum]
MLGSLLVMVLTAGEPAEALKKYEVKTLALQVPAEWKQSEADGTQRFDDPSGGAYLLVDVGAVQTAGMKPQVCLDKVLGAMGNEKGWQKLKLGKAPAARRVDTDTTPDGAESVETVTYVGCDGKTTWSLVFHMDTKQKDRFEALSAKVANSIAYAKPPAGKKGK